MIIDDKLLDTVICLGCGWSGDIPDLAEGSCPSCGYENGEPPWRLLTLREELDGSEELELANVRLDLFLKTLLELLELDVTQENRNI